MKLQMRVREGVARGLCGSCEHARVMVDDLGQQTVMCEENHPWITITRALVSCTDHQPRGTISKYEMEKIAWTIERDGNRFIGFAPPKKREEP